MPIDPAPIPPELRGMRVAVLVGGGIAAYKVADLVSQLVAAGGAVQVAMTASAARFVGPATFHGLTGLPVLGDLWSGTGAAEPHVALGDWAQVVLVAPATANLLARIAGGHGGDLVTTTVLAARCPVVIAPAMNDAMWRSAAVTANVARLRERGFAVAEPESGRLASGHDGTGRLASAGAILDVMGQAIRSRYDMAGRRVVVTAGGTRERIDAVRFISNYSSGRMGHAVAEAAADRGATVTLITTAPPPRHHGVSPVAVESAAEMLEAVRAPASEADLLVMVAAVADFRPAAPVAHKIKREVVEHIDLRLERNVDILAELAAGGLPDRLFRVGFAAEDQDLLERAQGKLTRKSLDAIVGNDITQLDGGFGSDHNEGVLVFADGDRVELSRATKRAMADRILDAVIPRLRD